MSGLILLVGPLALPAQAYEDNADSWTSTPTGPLGPADRDLLVRVRLAGLWEAPAGRMAQQQAGSVRVKEVGAILEADHIALDVQVRAVASELGVALPDVPNTEQQAWLDELAGKSGEPFDQAFAQLLRAAHGKVMSVVASVRAGTRNDTVRAFAQTAVTVVMKHMTVLESIGLVQYSSLPPPPNPALSRVPFGEREGLDVLLVWTVLAVAFVAGAPAVLRAIRPR